MRIGKNIKSRINRLIGQLKGIERMLNEGRSCEEVILQLTAVKKAVNGLTKEVLVSDVCNVIKDVKKKEELEKAIRRAVDL